MARTRVVDVVVGKTIVFGRRSICTSLGHFMHTLKMFLDLTVQL